MQSNDSELLVRADDVAHPEFTTERLALDTTAALDRIDAAVKGVTAAEADEGIKLRTRSGMLLAILTPADDGTDLHYRTAPASEPVTLKARRIWRALRPHAV